MVPRMLQVSEEQEGPTNSEHCSNSIRERSQGHQDIYVSWIAVKNLLTTKDREFQFTLNLQKMQSLVSLQK